MADPFSINSGPDFTVPWRLAPYRSTADYIVVGDSSGAAQTTAGTAFFTEMARRGLQDTTNWTADTYKTILSVTSGKGLVAAYIGCTAGGTQSHTVEFTVDGVVSEMTISSMASGERAIWIAGGAPTAFFSTTLNLGGFPGYYEVLDANKSNFTSTTGLTFQIPSWYMTTFMGIPCLRFNRSLLIRAKHSASITNSTSTAYSSVMYRLGL
jgi:hypothetical protein